LTIFTLTVVGQADHRHPTALIQDQDKTAVVVVVAVRATVAGLADIQVVREQADKEVLAARVFILHPITVPVAVAERAGLEPPAPITQGEMVV
jgi:uncharacterized membrane protein